MEAKLEKKLKDKVKSIGGWALKFTSGVRGVPDRIVLMPGRRIYFVEMKYGNNGLSPAQRSVQKILLSLGFETYNIWTEEQLENFIHEIRKNN